MGVKHTHTQKIPPFLCLCDDVVRERSPRSDSYRKTAKISGTEIEQTQRQGSALTRGERGKKKEPESIFKHFIVPAWEVTPKPPHAVRDKRPSKRILH